MLPRKIIALSSSFLKSSQSFLGNHLKVGCETQNSRVCQAAKTDFWAQFRGILASQLSAISASAQVAERDFLVYLTGREPVIRMSTSLLALCCQSGLAATLETPIRARSRSMGSRSFRISPFRIARFTSVRIASQI